MTSDEGALTVGVTCINDDDEFIIEYGRGDTVQDAVDYAVDLVREMTRDASYTMSNWWAA